MANGDGRDESNRRQFGSPLTRRRLLRRGGGLAFALSAGGSLLAACGDDDSSGASGGGGDGGGDGIGGIPRASKDNPVKLPIYDDNPAIKSGLKPESGPLEVFNWGDYISPGVLESFEKKHGVEVKLTQYASFEESLNKINSGAVKPDVWVPIVERLPQIVAAKLIQPLNHDYIPNLEGVVPSMADPYYDKGALYTVPNYISTTGILWRADLLPDLDPAGMDNPWDVFWTTPEAEGRMGLQNAQAFNSISLGLLHDGVTEWLNLKKPQVDKAVAAVEELTANGAKLQYTAFQPIANGTQVLAQAWSGDAFVAPAFLKKDTPADALQYYFPEDGIGLIEVDFWCVPASAEHPVLGHMFIDHFLELESALDNYKVVGYQTPLQDLTVDVLKERELAAPELLDMIYVTDTIADNGLPKPIPTPEQHKWYDAAFAQLSAG